ncbi:hypothetical protein [Paraburkholderia graminis]|uniref:hypothetical protein n=1 Tax=Paraburkholderia graminis TaxID=60548 RepID=UPI001FCA226A|nr:hypothetical protein [Paraburkholderia graminis]
MLAGAAFFLVVLLVRFAGVPADALADVLAADLTDVLAGDVVEWAVPFAVPFAVAFAAVFVVFAAASFAVIALFTCDPLFDEAPSAPPLASEVKQGRVGQAFIVYRTTVSSPRRQTHLSFFPGCVSILIAI